MLSALFFTTAALLLHPPFQPTRHPTHNIRLSAATPPPLDDDDPIYRDELWLDSAQVRYSPSGVGHCSSYTVRGFNHSRAILLLDPAPASESDLCALADKLALACECVALVPLLRGGRNQWPRERLAAEAWAAAKYLNGERNAESLAIVALGGAGASTVLGLLAEGALDAHAAVALCPDGSAGAPAEAARYGRELPVPLLAVCGGGGGGAYAAALRDGLSVNARLASDYYVAEFGESSERFLMAPQTRDEARAGEEAIALVQSWVDRYVPERLGRS